MLTNIVGYSSTDFFYENPSYCKKATDNTTKYAGEPNCDKGSIDVSGCPCTTNETYGSILHEAKTGMDTGIARYNNTLDVYNRELLRTINYLAGIGMLVAYIYVNQTNPV